MRALTKFLAGIALSINAFTAFSNELGNPGFEDNTSSHIYGNNFSPNISPWTAVGPPNVVQVDGPGGATWYDIGRPTPFGPQSDASGISGVRHYLDMQDSVGSIYQAFTTPEECSGEVRFGGFFSTRGNAAGEAHVEIREGTGMTGNLVGTTTVVNIPVLTNSAVDPWMPVNFTATLSAGTTYSFVIWMDNQLNFDEAYVNFVEGPCKDDSDLKDIEPEQCLILEPKVECVANKWQVSINNSSTSFNADVLDITSQTSGVTISGSSPTWVLNGALPNSSVDITVDGTVTGGGKADFADLCCTTKLHIDIPDETCEIVQEKPHIYTRKAYVETEEGKGEFRFVLDSWVQLNDPMTLTITDTIPAGVTLTSLDSANTTNWSCPGLPVAGPGTLVCTYIGAMPIPAGTNFNVLVYADVEPSTKDRKNCIKTNLVDTNSAGIPYDGMKEGCVEIPAEEEVVDKEPEIKTEKTCELTPKFGRYQPFTCKITVTASNLLGGGTINLSDSIINSGFTSINATSSTENWLCDPTPSSTSPFDCSLTEAELISAGGTSVIYISGMSEETLRNCASSSYTNGVGEVSSEACWNVIDEDDTEECSPPNVLIEGHCELPCETDSQCSSIDGAACLPFYNTETLVCQQPEPPIVCGEGEMLVDGVCVTQPNDEPDVPLACNSNIVIVADESGSIAEANAQWTVQNAIKSFAKGFKGHGSKAAVIHFDTNATLEKSMTEIATSSGQENDFDNNYAPVSGYTNWEAGLKLALAEVTTTPGSIVFFITDGQPNRYLDNSGNVQTGTEAQSVAEAVAVANLIKAAGSRIIAIGVGDITGSPNAQTNLNSIASSSVDTIVDDINNLNQIAVDYSIQACPDIYLSKRTVKNKNINLATGNLNTNKPEFLITVTNNTTTALTGITVQDALPIPKLTFNAFSAGSPSVGISSQTANVITWSGISLAPAASATLKFSANVAMQAGEKVYNYAEVTAVDQTVSSVNPLADPMAGPLNADDKDEGKDYVYVYDYISTPCAATSENPDKCLYIRKEIIKTEGACLPGAVCKYKITIRNGGTQAYTNPLAISDVYTPNTSGNITSITASGGAPTPMCSPNPTSIPFSCLQNTDLPASTTWTYIIETITPASGVDKNCLTVNSKTSCAIHPSTKSLQIVPEPDEETLIVDKFAPKTCKAGSKCKFTFTITNKMKKPYSGFVGITDKPRKRFGRIRGKSKGWSCKKKGREYRCSINKVSLNPDESKKLTLTLQVPRSLSGKVENCATIEAESPVSSKSCVTVDIINNRKCGYDDKLVNGRCVARCKNKNSNWNGVDCMVCRGGKTWNDRYKRCDKKPKEVIKSCPDHYRWSTAQKRCVYMVPRPTTKTCNKGTHYSAAKRRCVENSRPPACNKGTHYNAAKKRCVEDKRSHPIGCPAGQIYLSDMKRCVRVKKEHPKGGGGGCGGGEIWNIIYKKCEKLPEYEGGDDGGHTGGGGDHP